MYVAGNLMPKALIADSGVGFLLRQSRLLFAFRPNKNPPRQHLTDRRSTAAVPGQSIVLVV